MERHAIHREALSRLQLGELEDEEHLLLVYPNTQIVRECFYLALPLTHMSTLVGLM
jgi:hypothetical protein